MDFIQYLYEELKEMDKDKRGPILEFYEIEKNYLAIHYNRKER